MVFLSRLRAGRDQAYHLARRTQDGRPGRGQHSHGVEGCARGTGVSTQERTDPQVRRVTAVHSGTVIKLMHDFLSPLSTEGSSELTLRVYGADIRNSGPDFLFSVVRKGVKLMLCVPP